jgi:hypothetical protein
LFWRTPPNRTAQHSTAQHSTAQNPGVFHFMSFHVIPCRSIAFHHRTPHPAPRTPRDTRRYESIQ